MKPMTKPFILLVFLLTTVTFANAQDAPKIDESTLITQLIGISNLSQTQADNYLTSKKYAVSSNSVKKLELYDANFVKYKMIGSTDSYTIVLVKDKIINVMFITYSDSIYPKALDDALKAGFKKSEPANPNSPQAVYAMDNERFIIQTINANNKTFYVMSMNNLVVTAKAVADAKPQ